MDPTQHAGACRDSSRLQAQTPDYRGRRLGWSSAGLLFALTYWSAPAGADASAGNEFRITQTTRIGGEGSWDYAAYDAARHRLFVARVGGTLVLDANTMKAAGSIPALAGTRVHGVAFAGEFGIGMTSDGNDQTSTVFDLATLAPLRRVALGIAPDAIVYDPASHQGVGFDGDDNLAVAFDPRTGGISARVKLPGSPEAAAADGKGRLYVNLSDMSAIAAIDTRTWTVAGHWPIGGGCEEPTPLAVDPVHERLFAGCRSGVLVVVDATTHALIASLPIGKGADGIAYDPGSSLIFVSCNDGTLTIIKAISASRYGVVQNLLTTPAARTLAVDPHGPRVFLPAADLGPLLPKTGDVPARPAIIPSTFRILTVGR
jgi:DNA-binding beta-propeller fold protein YncE